MSNKLNAVKFDDKSNNQLPEGRQNPTEWEWWVDYVNLTFLHLVRLALYLRSLLKVGHSTSFVSLLIKLRYKVDAANRKSDRNHMISRYYFFAVATWRQVCVIDLFTLRELLVATRLNKPNLSEFVPMVLLSADCVTRGDFWPQQWQLDDFDFPSGNSPSRASTQRTISVQNLMLIINQRGLNSLPPFNQNVMDKGLLTQVTLGNPKAWMSEIRWSQSHNKARIFCFLDDFKR